MRRSRQNHRSRFLPTVVRCRRTFTYHADGQLASASCDGIGRAGAHASSDIASQCSLRSGDMRTPPSADTQWRKSESLSHIAIIDGAIWLTQTDIASGSMTNKVCADGKGPTYGIFNVEIEDYYEWVKDDGAMDKIKEFLSRLASSAYDAAVYMQKNCGNKSFGHKESFSLECNGCCE